MGIGINIAELCVKEHVRRPLGETMLFGRQTMFFTPRMALELLDGYGISAAAGGIGIDRSTVAASGDGIRDDEFFRLLGVKSIRVLDRSAYEGADLIHDLNFPIPDELDRSADFILDGSTLDNVWNPSVALTNMARILRPGGRIVSVNMASNHHGPYLVMSPTWVLDYFVVNRFADCRVAVTVIRADGAFNTFNLDLDSLNRNHIAPNFESRHMMGLQFVAEKGHDSTWDRIPTQQQYRPSAEWDEYEDSLERIRLVPARRTGFWRSGVSQMMSAPPGYKFVAPGPASMGTRLRQASSRAAWLTKALARKFAQKLRSRAH